MDQLVLGLADHDMKVACQQKDLTITVLRDVADLTTSAVFGFMWNDLQRGTTWTTLSGQKWYNTRADILTYPQMASVLVRCRQIYPEIPVPHYAGPYLFLQSAGQLFKRHEIDFDFIDWAEEMRAADNQTVQLVIAASLTLAGRYSRLLRSGQQCHGVTEGGAT